MFLIQFDFSASILEQFEKAKEKFNDHREPKMPEITLDVLRRKRRDILDKQNSKLVNGNVGVSASFDRPNEPESAKKIATSA